MPLSKSHSPLTVSIGGTTADPNRYVVLSFTRSMGGAKVDQAVIRVERAPSAYLQLSTARALEIDKPLSIFHNGSQIFWGIVEDASFSAGDSPDEKHIVASIQPWHFGPPITQSQYIVLRKRNGRLGTVTERVKSDDPIVFNGFPKDREWVSKGTATFVGNKTLGRQYQALTRDGKPTKDKTAMLIPLEAVQTDVGRARYAATFVPFARLTDDGLVAGSGPSGGFEWTLRDAVRYVCVLGNDEKYIDNPSDADYSLLPNFVLPRTELEVGKYLPDYLDALLLPYGFNWYVEPNPKAPGLNATNADPKPEPATSGAAAVAGLTNGGQAAIAGVSGSGSAAVAGLIAGGQSIIAGLTSLNPSAERPKIRFSKFGVGPEVSARYAKVGQDADFDTTNVLNFEHGYSVSQTINEIEMIGGTAMIEGTFELKRVAADKWVLNEGADYDAASFLQHRTQAELEAGVAASGGGVNEVTAPELTDLIPTSLFGTWGVKEGFVQRIQRPRRFLPTITAAGVLGEFGEAATVETKPIGPNNGYDIEVIDLSQDDATPGQEVWNNIDKIDDPMFRHVRVLENECGVVFDRGHTDTDEEDTETRFAYFEALDTGDAAKPARLRITATIECDFAIQTVIKRRLPAGAFSPSSQKHTWVWRDPRRWPCRLRIVSGAYATKYADSTYTIETPPVDAIVADMTAQARAILDRLDSAKINGTVAFNSFDNVIPLGGIIKKIAGREWKLNTRHDKDAPKYPQVVAVHWDTQSAMIVATLTTEPASALEAFG